MITQKFVENTAILGAIHAVSQGVGAVSSAWVPVSEYARIVALVDAGALGASATVDAKLEQATDSSGTGAKDITGKALTQLADGADDNSNHVIECRASELDKANSFDHVRLTITVATAASLVSGVVLGCEPIHKPTVHGFDQAV